MPSLLSVLEELYASSRYRDRQAIPKYQRGRSFTVSLTGEPTRNLSPMFSSVSKSPVVVKFSPNIPPGSSNLTQFMLPVVIVSGRIDVNRLASSSMDGKISLAVSVEVERSEHDTACHRLFENSRRYWLAVAHNDPRKTNIDGDDLNSHTIPP